MTFNEHRAGLIAGGTIAAVLAAVALSWRGGLSTDLMLTLMSMWHLVTGDWVLPLRPDWGGMAVRLLAAGVAGLLAWRTLRSWRVGQGRCARCGRRAAPRDFATISRRLALVSIVPSVGYAALKLHWAFGGTVGLHDRDAFAGIKPWSPGFADTALLALISVGLICAMAYNWRRIPRWMLAGGGLIGCVMLLPAGVTGLIGTAYGAFDGVESDLALWVRALVYACFTIWGMCLAVVTAAYLHRGRRICRTCGRA